MAGTPPSDQAPTATSYDNSGESSAYANLTGTGSPVPERVIARGRRLPSILIRRASQIPRPAILLAIPGRNALEGPGFANVDVSLVKGFRMPFLGEAGLGQFRFEAFNVFNRTNFSNPNTSITSSSFGQLTSTAGDPRILQLALKFAF